MNIKKITKILILTIALPVVSLTTKANEIILSKNIITFEQNQSKKITIDIVNLKKENTTYVEATVREVLEPHKGTNSKMISGLSPRDSGLFVTPNKQIINSGEKSGLLTIVNVNKKLDKERVYRVDVKPVISGVNVDEMEGPAIKVLWAYDVLVYVQPNNPTMTFEHEFTLELLKIKNSGNSHFKISELQFCDNQNYCKEGRGGNVFAGNVVQWRINKNINYVTYNISMDGKKSKSIRLDRNPL